MTSAPVFVSLTKLGFIQNHDFLVRPKTHIGFSLNPIPRISMRIRSHQNQNFIISNPSKTRDLRIFSSIELDHVLTNENEMSEGFFEAIEELENMAREPSDVLEEMNNRLSVKELQLVLVYFSQEGRDSWCALEVFEWLKKENRVDKETMELMVSIMCSWVKKLIEEEVGVGDVVDLLVDMDCVGLKPGFSMIEKVISLYWDMGKRENAVSFVQEVLKRKIDWLHEDGDEHKGGPIGFLAWKMMAEDNYKKAVELVINFRESDIKPEVYSYLIAMTAVVKELNELSKSLRKLKGFARQGLVAELDNENVNLIENYKSDLISNGLRLANWAIHEGSSSIHGVIHERLLAMYICAGCGLEAEKQLWEMKFFGKEPDEDLYDIVLAICASQNEVNAISRLLTRIEVMSFTQKKKTLSWLVKGYVKGGHFDAGAKILIKILDLGLFPDYLDRAAVLQGLRRGIQNPADLETYIDLCKRLSNAGLIEPCLAYLYKKKFNLWIIKML